MNSSRIWVVWHKSARIWEEEEVAPSLLEMTLLMNQLFYFSNQTKRSGKLMNYPILRIKTPQCPLSFSKRTLYSLLSKGGKMFLEFYHFHRSNFMEPSSKPLFVSLASKYLILFLIFSYSGTYINEIKWLQVELSILYFYYGTKSKLSLVLTVDHHGKLGKSMVARIRGNNRNQLGAGSTEVRGASSP